MGYPPPSREVCVLHPAEPHLVSSQAVPLHPAAEAQGAVPDVKMMEFKRAELREHFDDLYRLLNRKTVIKARAEKLARLTSK